MSLEKKKFLHIVLLIHINKTISKGISGPLGLEHADPISWLN
jgi:hypothetical protein